MHKNARLHASFQRLYCMICQLATVGYSIYVYIAIVLLASVMTLSVIMLPAKQGRAVLRAFFRLAAWLFAWRIQSHGDHRIGRAGAGIYVMNHASYVDIAIAIAYLPSDTVFVSKQEALKLPIVGYVMRKFGHIGIDRYAPNKATGYVRKIRQVLSTGKSVVIFPEGTFTEHSGLRPFKLGAFKMALAIGCPIYPIALRNVRKILRLGECRFRPQKVTITVGRPIDTACLEDAKRLATDCRDFIAGHCGEPMLDDC